MTATIRLFRIRYQWRRYSKTFSAVTVWRFAGDGRDALDNFIQRNPHIISASVEREIDEVQL
jgi:hypothetical protein